MSRFAESALFRSFERLRDGFLEVRWPGGSRVFGDPAAPLRAAVEIADRRFFSRVLFGGEVALGETYTDGLWTSPDLFALARVGVRLAAGAASSGLLSAVARTAHRVRHRSRRNTVAGSRRNIEAHYDLGNDFYALFLDRRHLAYSCAYFERPDVSLEEAQEAKFERIAAVLELSPAQHVLEIGTGWGGFAIWAATRYGCRVTTTTISRAQHDYVRDRIARDGLADRITLLYEDYRRLTGTFDRIVSIEMFEAVGLANYDAFFSAMDRLLSRGGAFFLQTITMNETRFPAYRREADWIQLNVFPGAELASVSEVLRSIGRTSRLTLIRLDDIGAHYVRTLLEWRARFFAARDRVRELGFDERFVRLWDFYLAGCAAAFAERHIGDAQMLFVGHPSESGRIDEPAPPDVPVARSALPAR